MALFQNSLLTSTVNKHKSLLRMFKSHKAASPAPQKPKKQKASKRQRLSGILFIYNPHHDENVTLDARLKIEVLKPVPEQATLQLCFIDDDDSEKVRVKTEIPFKDNYLLGEIIPQQFRPDNLTPKKTIRIRLSVKTKTEILFSQPGYRIRLIQAKQSATVQHSQRQYCQVPWKRGRLGGRNASPCRHLVRKFHVPNHQFAEDYDPWNSDTMSALRHSLVSGENKYCFHGCPSYTSNVPIEMHSEFSGDTLIKQNIDLARKEYLQGNLNIKSKPIVLVVKLGTPCDNYCTFCSIHETPSPYVITGQTLDRAKLWYPYARNVIFTGGEPLMLRKQIKHIIADQPPQKGKQIRFNTNGTRIKHNLDLLSTFEELTLSISLNTPCPETYQRLHGTNSYQDVLDGIRLVKQARQGLKTKIHLKMLVMHSTYNQAMDFSRLAVDMQVNTVIFRHLRWYERLKIDVSEKLMANDPTRKKAVAAVEDAREFLIENGVKAPAFYLDGRADDVTA